MGELATFVKEHPAAIGIAVIVVALLAYFQSKTSAPVGDGEVTFVGGGTVNAQIDPGVVAIEEARIDAGARNLGTLASLVLGSEQSESAYLARRAEIDASLTSDLARTETTRTTTLADIAARQRVALATTAASIDVANISALSSRQLAEINANANMYAANLTAELTRQANAAQAEAIRLQHTQELERLATERDVARVRAKSEFWDDAFGFVGDTVSSVVSFFNPFD